MKWILGCAGLLLVCRFASFAIFEDSPAPAPEEIIRKAVEARGGKEALAKHLNRRVRVKGFMLIDDKKAPMKIFYLYRHPDHTKLIGEVTLPSGGLCKITNVFNGKTIWTKQNGTVTDGSDMDLQEERMAAYMAYVEFLFPLLNNDLFKLSELPPAKFNHRDTLGIRVYSKGFGFIGLHFDRQTWLLVKSESISEENSRKGSLHETYWDEYKKIKGVMYPTKMLTVLNGKKHLETELVDIEPLEKVDDSEFSKP